MEPNRSARNERRKLTASYLNTLSAAVITLGALAPVAAVAYGNATPSVPVIAIGAAICIGTSLILHSLARWYLGGIEE